MNRAVCGSVAPLRTYRQNFHRARQTRVRGFLPVVSRFGRSLLKGLVVDSFCAFVDVLEQESRSFKFGLLSLPLLCSLSFVASFGMAFRTFLRQSSDVLLLTGKIFGALYLGKNYVVDAMWVSSPQVVMMPHFHTCGQTVGPSMQPTLGESKGVVLISPLLSDARLGDVVVCKSPVNPSEYVVKRIIGMVGCSYLHHCVLSGFLMHFWSAARRCHQNTVKECLG